MGILGSGIVGEAIQDLIFKHQLRADPELEIIKIFTRNPKVKRWYPAHPELFSDRPQDVTDHPEAQIVVEALGSEEEGQLSHHRDYIVRAFQQGKGVVTSDKAVLARHGKEIWEAARRFGQEIRFEACVGGGVPIIRSLTESFAAEEPEAIYGIINGTSNYILSEMEKGGKSYEEALREAQERGYAETNPKSDTGGMDAEAKLILLAAVTFGVHFEPGSIWRQGIEEIHAIDFLYADRKGRGTIKPLAAAWNEGGAVQSLVSPALVPRGHFLSSIAGPTNGLFFKGKRSGELPAGRRAELQDWNYMFAGPGAGGGPTAVAVLGDVYDLARGGSGHPEGPPSLVDPGVLTAQPADKISACFYIRFVVKDRPGIVGDICQTFGNAGINVSEIWQLSHDHDELESLTRQHRISQAAGKILPFVITLERTSVGQVNQALRIVARQDYMLIPPIWFPIWRN